MSCARRELPPEAFRTPPFNAATTDSAATAQLTTTAPYRRAPERRDRNGHGRRSDPSVRDPQDLLARHVPRARDRLHQFLALHGDRRSVDRAPAGWRDRTAQPGTRP